MLKIARLISTLGRVGYLPAPGTVASAIVFFIGYFLQSQELLTGLVVLIVVVILFFCTHFYSRATHEHDPQYIVSDEVTASLLLVWLIPHSLFYFILTFALFRFFDIKKPLGIKSLEKLPGVYGIISDDLLAGFYTLVVIRLIQFVS